MTVLLRADNLVKHFPIRQGLFGRASATVHAVDGVSFELRAGEFVSVTPSDYGKVPVTGELMTLNVESIALLRHDPRVGDVITHFPRIGYHIVRVDST